MQSVNLNPDYFHKVVDCQWACPAHTPVPEYIRLIAQGRYADAYMINWVSNVFPGVLGRTCDRPCEPACRRGRVEENNGVDPEPVAICRLQRVAADNKGDVQARMPSISKKNGKQIACVGAGPSSLTVARDLAPLGYDVTIYDSEIKAGLNPYAVQSSPFGNIPLSDNQKLADALSNQIRAKSKSALKNSLNNSESIKDPKDLEGAAAKAAKILKDKEDAKRILDDKYSTWDKVKNTVSTVASNIGSGISKAANFIKDKVYEPGKEAAKQVLSNIGTGLNKAGKWAGNIAGSVLEKAKYAISKFVDMGWTKEQAAGIAANTQTESSFNPSVVGDGRKAYGIGQWHPDRQANFAKVFGKSIQGSSLDEQLQFIDWELKHTESKAGNKLKGASTADQAGAIVSQFYERPAAVEKEKANRGALANTLLDKSNASPATVTADNKPTVASSGPVIPPLSLDAPRSAGPRAAPTQSTLSDTIASIDSNKVNGIDASSPTSSILNSSTTPTKPTGPTVDSKHISTTIASTAQAAAGQRDKHLEELKGINASLQKVAITLASSQSTPTAKTSPKLSNTSTRDSDAPMVDMSL